MGHFERHFNPFQPTVVEESQSIATEQFERTKQIRKENKQQKKLTNKLNKKYTTSPIIIMVNETTP